MDIEQQTYVIGVDIGGTHTRIGAVTSDGTLHFFLKRKTKDIVDVKDPIESLKRFLYEYIELYVSGKKVLAVGMGFPSVVSKDKKRILTTTTMESLCNVNIVDPLQDYLKIPVYIDNDVNHLLKYEISKRNVMKDDIVLGFYIGTGFGNAIYLHDQFLSGKNGAAAELGHIPVYQNGDVCGCGNIGCVEVIASGKRLVALHQEHFSDVPFEEIFTKCAHEKIIEDFIHALAIPIATEINIFDPHLVILGGGVVGMKNFPKERLEEKVIQSCRRPFPAGGLNFEYAEDVNAAGVLGAASHIYDQLKRENVIKIG
ncbi:allose kinase [Bacillus sp. FJAT-29790]|uniref:allose kinase n=1 Tax=Bacillus sp. FJAT-29790 TaxID=1895002 RepID=UPI001C24E4B4|nr:allose kinase [Bacillus sp. FJAT-29790]MBU8879250.1 allose kinase [Bacillus sp. FJAT-29790]